MENLARHGNRSNQNQSHPHPTHLERIESLLLRRRLAAIRFRAAKGSPRCPSRPNRARPRLADRTVLLDLVDAGRASPDRISGLPSLGSAARRLSELVRQTQPEAEETLALSANATQILEELDTLGFGSVRRQLRDGTNSGRSTFRPSCDGVWKLAEF